MVQPGSIVQETAAEIDQGIAAAARDDVDHPADGDSGGKMVDGLLQHAIDRADSVIEDRRARQKVLVSITFDGRSVLVAFVMSAPCYADPVIAQLTIPMAHHTYMKICTCTNDWM